jgi:hypothetical protein
VLPTEAVLVVVDAVEVEEEAEVLELVIVRTEVAV